MIEFDETLKTILRVVKSRETLSVDGITSALKTLYSANMTSVDVFHIVLCNYLKMLDEPKFKMHNMADAIESVIFSPLEMRWPHNKIDDFYATMLIKMLNDMRFSHKDWLPADVKEFILK